MSRPRWADLEDDPDAEDVWCKLAGHTKPMKADKQDPKIKGHKAAGISSNCSWSNSSSTY